MALRASKDSGTLLFNPTSLVHDRHVSIFRERMEGWRMRCVYNPQQPWFKRRRADGESFFFTGKHLPRLPDGIFEDVRAVVLFTAQSRVPPARIIEEAAFKGIPVIAIEESYAMLLEQGYVNNYCLPVDHFFVATDYEREGFIRAGIPADVIETTGYMFRGSILRERRDVGLRRDLRRELGLSGDRPVATLALTFMLPDGETPEVRRDLLTLVSRGLPEKYELIVKPHPSESDASFKDYILECAPRAKIADPRVPIDDVLDITDVLFSRGNSQVVLEALQRSVPVVALPVGRKVFFRGILDQVTAERDRDIPDILEIIGAKGMSIYDEVIGRFLKTSPECAAETCIKRIVDIAEKKSLYEVGSRLMELALYWAWLGYKAKASALLNRAASYNAQNAMAGPIARLISGEAVNEDLVALREWGNGFYRKHIIQSLWIKTLHEKGLSIKEFEREWFSDFPPDMNRPRFIPYAAILFWLYLKSGMKSEAEKIASAFSAGYDSVGEISNIRSALVSMNSQGNGFPKSRYWKARFRHSAMKTVRSVIERMESVRT